MNVSIDILMAFLLGYLESVAVVQVNVVTHRHESGVELDFVSTV
jgi:hypothetical protein